MERELGMREEVIPLGGGIIMSITLPVNLHSSRTYEAYFANPGLPNFRLFALSVSVGLLVSTSSLHTPSRTTSPTLLKPL